MQDHDRAWILGDNTFGKGLVQTVYPLVEKGYYARNKYLELQRNEQHVEGDLAIAESDIFAPVAVLQFVERRLRLLIFRFG